MPRRPMPKIIRTEKICRLCGQTKPMAEFHKRSASRDGHHSACRECAMAEQNRSRIRPRPILSEKPCATCKQIKPLSAFVKNRVFYDGRNHVCKECLYAQRRAWGATEAGKAVISAGIKRRYWLDPVAERDRKLSNYYGIPRGTYAQMLAEQNGKCAICGRTENPGKTRFAIDHDHETGALRGLLCTCCNQAIGQFQEIPELLRKAAEYLERWAKCRRPGYL